MDNNKEKNIIIGDQIISKILLMLLLLSIFDERWIPYNIALILFHGYNISFLVIGFVNILYLIIKKKLKRDKWRIPD